MSIHRAGREHDLTLRFSYGDGPIGLQLRALSLSFSVRKGAGEGSAGCLRGLGACVSAGVEPRVLRFAGRGACLQFRLSVALNGTSCAAKQGVAY